jgi:hypothetical protein
MKRLSLWPDQSQGGGGKRNGKAIEDVDSVAIVPWGLFDWDFYIRPRTAISIRNAMYRYCIDFRCRLRIDSRKENLMPTKAEGKR